MLFDAFSVSDSEVSNSSEDDLSFSRLSVFSSRAFLLCSAFFSSKFSAFLFFDVVSSSSEDERYLEKSCFDKIFPFLINSSRSKSLSSSELDSEVELSIKFLCPVFFVEFLPLPVFFAALDLDFESLSCDVLAFESLCRDVLAFGSLCRDEVFVAFCFVLFVTAAVAIVAADAVVDVDVVPSLDALAIDMFVFDAVDDLLLLGPEGLAAVTVDVVFAAVDFVVAGTEDLLGVDLEVVGS